MHERRLPEPGGEGQAPEGPVPGGEELSQRALALDLRYYIDLRQAATVRRLVTDNPVNFASRHVQHNLGQARLKWLAAEGIG